MHLTSRSAGLFAVLLVCIPLLAVDHHFFGDWDNHLGMIGYTAEYFKAHGTFPTTFHTEEVLGRATPLFYGNIYLPLAGLLGAFAGARLGLSLLVVAVLALQFSAVRRLILDGTNEDRAATSVAVVVTWSIYPMTDLYNRSAVPEFLATALFVAGLCTWLRFALDPPRYRHQRVELQAGLWLALGAATHPPTALMGGATFGVLWLVTLWFTPDRKRLLQASAVAGSAGLVLLAPWLYVVSCFHRDLAIVVAGQTQDLTWFPTSLDWIFTRLSPLPTLGYDSSSVSTPHLDAQVNVALLVTAAAMVLLGLHRRLRGGARESLLGPGLVAALVCGVLLVASTYRAAWRLIPAVFKMIQFPYRLVAFVNAAAVAALAVLIIDRARAGGLGRTVRVMLSGAVALAGLGVAFKIPRALEGGSSAPAIKSLLAPPSNFYGSGDYATHRAFAHPRGSLPVVRVNVPLAPPSDFGLTGTVHVKLEAKARLASNVQTFPWNHLVVDGRVLSKKAMLSDDDKLGAVVEPGEHEVGYRFDPDRAWSWLRWLSGATFVGWSLLVVGPSIAAGARRLVAFAIWIQSTVSQNVSG